MKSRPASERLSHLTHSSNLNDEKVSFLIGLHVKLNFYRLLKYHMNYYFVLTKTGGQPIEG